MKTSEAQLRAITKWRTSNREKYNEKAKVSSLKYYHDNKEKVLEKKKLYYLKKKLAKEELKEKTIDDENIIFSEIIDEIENSIIKETI